MDHLFPGTISYHDLGIMEHATALDIPKRALQRLEFLVGDYAGTQTLYPPDGKPVTYQAFCTISREACERFLKVEFFAEVPDYGIESFTAFVTYSSKKESYQMWVFSSSAEEPLHMTGSVTARGLVLISEPWSMPWGLQRLRGTFTPNADGSFDHVSELWEPDGYTMFRQTHLERLAVEL